LTAPGMPLARPGAGCGAGELLLGGLGGWWGEVGGAVLVAEPGVAVG
jgi:hypothetical protein